mmetsp:Transcript_4260/g.11989  ORF Transcript_4260/g.11989 Transcript_4260/m.11989 type:complete len:216 (-) Transcript_4260:106-753(-)
MWMVLSVCFITWSARSRQAPVSRSRTQMWIQPGIAGLVPPAALGAAVVASVPSSAAVSALGGSASAPHAPSPGALAMLALLADAATSPSASSAPPPSGGAATSSAALSWALRFRPLPPSAGVRFARSAALSRVKLWKEWQPSKCCMTRCSRRASSSAPTPASAPSRWSSRAGSRYSYSRQEHAVFESKLFGTRTAPKHRTSSGRCSLTWATSAGQ